MPTQRLTQSRLGQIIEHLFFHHKIPYGHRSRPRRASRITKLGKAENNKRSGIRLSPTKGIPNSLPDGQYGKDTTTPSKIDRWDRMAAGRAEPLPSHPIEDSKWNPPGAGEATLNRIHRWHEKKAFNSKMVERGCRTRRKGRMHVYIMLQFEPNQMRQRCDDQAPKCQALDGDAMLPFQ